MRSERHSLRNEAAGARTIGATRDRAKYVARGGLLIWKTDNHAVVIGRLAKEQLPWSERKDLSAELLQHGANLRAVAITSLWVTNGCFNNDICAHSSVLSVSWSMAVLNKLDD